MNQYRIKRLLSEILREAPGGSQYIFLQLDKIFVDFVAGQYFYYIGKTQKCYLEFRYFVGQMSSKIFHCE